jgi:hypothetical protein
MSDDTIPGQLQEPRKRQIVQYDPNVSLGTIIQLFVTLGVVAGLWGQYQSDKTTTRLELDQVKAAAAVEKTSTKESLVELKADVKSIQTTVTAMDKTLAIIQANQPKGK